MPTQKERCLTFVRCLDVEFETPWCTVILVMRMRMISISGLFIWKAQLMWSVKNTSNKPIWLTNSRPAEF